MQPPFFVVVPKTTMACDWELTIVSFDSVLHRRLLKARFLGVC